MFDDKQRLGTGLALVIGFVIMGVTDYYPVIWLFLGAVFLLSFYESIKLFDIQNQEVLIYAIAMWLATLLFSHPEIISFLVLIIFGSLFAYNPDRFKNDIKIFLYPTIPAFFLLGLYTEYGIGSLFWIVAIVAGTDTGAYFAGKAFGKTPFNPISPKKTIEGVIGGIIAGTVIGMVFGFAQGPFLVVLVVSLFGSISSVFGDLFESYLKRQAGVKDSGNILPGHGGMLDRADGYFFTSVVMFSLLQGLS